MKQVGESSAAAMLAAAAQMPMLHAGDVQQAHLAAQLGIHLVREQPLMQDTALRPQCATISCR